MRIMRERWIVEEITVISFEGDVEKEEAWWAARDLDDVGNTFEVRNRQTAERLCELLNGKELEMQENIKDLKACHVSKLSALKELKCCIEKRMMDMIILIANELGGVEYEIESDTAVCFYSVPRHDGNLKYSAIYDLLSQLKGMNGLVIDISEAEESDDKKDMLYVQIEVGK